MSLKKDTRNTLLDVLKKEGMPPIIDKTFNSIWEAFAKTQPSILSSASSSDTADTDIWGNLQKCLEKFGVQPNIAKKVVTAMKKKFGETPSISDIKVMMST